MNSYVRLPTVLFVCLLSTACDWLQQPSPLERQAQNVLDESRNAPLASDEFLSQFKTLSCTPNSVGYCDKDVCQKSDNPPYVNIQYNVADRKYVRIGKKGERDEYLVEVHHGGIYTYISKPSGGIVLKVSTNGSYSEALSMMDTWFVYHGTCKFIK